MKKALFTLPAFALLIAACVGDSPTSNPTPDGGTDAPSNNDASSCAAPKTSCTKGSQTVCTDTASDDANCGACNTVCPTGSTCKSSSCACTDGTKTFCKTGNACVDTKSDPKNCGACDATCPTTTCTNGQCEKIVFVSKAGMGTDFGGVNQADAACAAAAKAAGLGSNFQAWISDGTVAPSNNFKTKSTTAYVLPDGTKVANSFAALGAGNLLHGIDMTEDKTTLSSVKVMTNVKINGDVNTVSFTCGNWATASGNFFGGTSGAVNAEWTDGASGTACSTALIYHLYCFQQ